MAQGTRVTIARAATLATFVVCALAFTACRDGDTDDQRRVDAALLTAADLPGDGWSDAAARADSLFALAGFLGISPDALRDSPACAPYRDLVEERLIEFAHVPTTGSALTAYRRGTLPLTQVLVVHAIAAYASERRAESAAAELDRILGAESAAPCLDALVAAVGEGLASARASVAAPTLSLPGSTAYAFRVDATVLIVPVGAAIEAHVVRRGRLVALYLLIDYNTQFLDRDAQPLLDTLDARLTPAGPG